MTRQRVIYLDVIRIVACLMIVLMHSPHPNAGNPGYVVTPLSFFTAAGIGLFFMVSGSLLLPVQPGPAVFLRKRLGKVIIPTLFWTFFYLAVQFFFDGRPIGEIGRSVLSIPFSTQGHGVLWFMYVLIGLYLLAPIISPFLIAAKSKEVRFYLILWAITLCFPWLKQWLTIDDSVTGILYYFTGYSGYFILGYYLNRYVDRIHPLLSLALIVIPVILLWAYVYTGHQGWQSSGRFWYLSPFVVMMCIGWFYLIRWMCNKWTISERASERLVHISNCCFGVYLMHIFVMRYLLWNSELIVHRFGGIGQIIITWGLTLIICFTLTWLIAKIPYSGYIVGYRNRRKQ